MKMLLKRSEGKNSIRFKMKRAVLRNFQKDAYSVNNMNSEFGTVIR